MDFPVFVARGSIARSARQALEDLAALNLVRDFIWIDLDAVTSTETKVTVVRRGSAPERVPLQRAVGVLQGTPAQLHLVTVIGDVDQSGLVATRDLNRLDAVLNDAAIRRTNTGNNLIFTVVNAEYDQASLPTFSGYRNLLVAPEDSESPDSGAHIFAASDGGAGNGADGGADNGADDEPPFTQWMATTLASLAGAWVGFEGTPTEHLEDSQAPRLVRAYAHRVSAEELQQQLQDAIFDTSQTPIPEVRENLNRINVRRQPQRGELERAVAHQFLTENAAAELVARPKKAVKDAGTQIDVKDAVRHQFTAWLTNMFTHPARFMGDLRKDAIESANAAVQAAVYGTTNTSKTVGSVTVDSGEQVKEVEPVLQDPAAIARQQGSLWATYAANALAIVDAKDETYAGNTAQARPRAMHNSQGEIQVVQAPGDSVPGPSQAFGADMPPNVQQVVRPPVAAYDLTHVQQAEAQLSRRAADQEFLHARNAFSNWQRQHQDSYAAQVAFGLRDMYRDQEEKLRRAREELRLIEAEEQETEDISPMHGVLRWIGWVAFWSLAIFLIAWGFGNMGAAAPRWLWVENLNAAPGKWKGWMFGIWFVIWLISYMLQILIETLYETRIRNRAFDREARRQQAELNVKAAEQALLYIQVGFQQFKATSDIVGALIERPFGAITHRGTRPELPTNAMPAAVAIDTVETSPREIDEIAARYRQGLYRGGWLSSQVQDTLDAALQDLANDPRRALRINRPELYGHLAGGPGSPLTEVASYVTSPEFVDQDRYSNKWLPIVNQLRQDQLVQAKLHPRSRVQSPGFFRREILSEIGQTKNFHDVPPGNATKAGVSAAEDLSSSSVIVHAGKTGLTVEDLRLRGSAQVPTFDPVQPRSTAADQLGALYNDEEF